jgi:hypothetical protein
LPFPANGGFQNHLRWIKKIIERGHGLNPAKGVESLFTGLEGGEWKEHRLSREEMHPYNGY